MKKKLIIITCVLVLVILTFVLLDTCGTKPFAKLSANEVVSAELFVVPPETTISLTDKDDMPN